MVTLDQLTFSFEEACLMKLTEKQKMLINNLENVVRLGLSPHHYEEIQKIYRDKGWQEAKEYIVKQVIKG